jgi:hypothetical protein
MEGSYLDGLGVNDYLSPSGLGSMCPDISRDVVVAGDSVSCAST